jgi:hypothetical protein
VAATILTSCRDKLILPVKELAQRFQDNDTPQSQSDEGKAMQGNGFRFGVDMLESPCG